MITAAFAEELLQRAVKGGGIGISVIAVCYGVVDEDFFAAVFALGNQNQAFFAAMLALTLAVGGAAFYAKWLRRQADGSPYPKFTAGLLALALALLLAFATGLLGI
mgnify:CR=1 FL=1